MAIASVKTNLQAGFAAQSLRRSIDDSSSAAIRMSSGQRITKASDDASGLAIGTGLESNVATLKSNLTNTSQALSILSIADGAMSNIGEILQRMKALTSQANSGSMSTSELGFILTELDQISDELERVAGQTSFNGQTMLDGTFTARSFQVGFGATDTINVSMPDMRTSMLVLQRSTATSALPTLSVSAAAHTPGAVTVGGVTINEPAWANTELRRTIFYVDRALDTLKTERADIGALQSRFGFAGSNIETSIQNTDAARADYMDADLASESSAFTNAQVRIQAGISVLAQVNQLPHQLLNLLG